MWQIVFIPVALSLALIGFLTDTADTMLPIAFLLAYITLGSLYGDNKKQKRRRPTPRDESTFPYGAVPGAAENDAAFPIPPILGAPSAEGNLPGQATDPAAIPNTAEKRQFPALDDFLDELDDLLERSLADKNDPPRDEESRAEEKNAAPPQQAKANSPTPSQPLRSVPSPYNLDPHTALKAVALAEILGKPKALKNGFRRRIP